MVYASDTAEEIGPYVKTIQDLMPHTDRITSYETFLEVYKHLDQRPEIKTVRMFHALVFHFLVVQGQCPHKDPRQLGTLTWHKEKMACIARKGLKKIPSRRQRFRAFLSSPVNPFRQGARMTQSFVTIFSFFFKAIPTKEDKDAYEGTFFNVIRQLEKEAKVLQPRLADTSENVFATTHGGKEKIETTPKPNMADHVQKPIPDPSTTRAHIGKTSKQTANKPPPIVFDPTTLSLTPITTSSEAKQVAGKDDTERIESLDRLWGAAKAWMDNHAVALNVEGEKGSIRLIEIATTQRCFRIDPRGIGESDLMLLVKPLLENPRVTKYMHNCVRAMYTMHQRHGIMVKGVFDTQLVTEWLTGRSDTDMNDFLMLLGDRRFSCQGNTSMVPGIHALMKCHVSMKALLADRLGPDAEQTIAFASDLRVKQSTDAPIGRPMWYDTCSGGHRLVSAELLQAQGKDAMPITEHMNAFATQHMLPQSIVDLLPSRYDLKTVDALQGPLVEIILDVGRPAHVMTLDQQRINLTGKVHDRGRIASWMKGFFGAFTKRSRSPSIGEHGEILVCHADLDAVIGKLGGKDSFGQDGRRGMDGQLHRISAMFDRTGQHIFGLTIRVGRAFPGSAVLFKDILFGSPRGDGAGSHMKKSILLLGAPGTGKTTFIRDMARMLTEAGNATENVCIIDTSNELAGDGVVPHPCIGGARRMMVPSLDAQHRIMVQAIQNHTPRTLVVDEIGRREECLAAQTARQRGVRLLASAHGDLRGLIRNPELNGLIGGTETVIMGDAYARGTGQGSKLKTQRAGTPCFDVILQLTGTRNEVVVIDPVAAAVDAVLEERPVRVERRTRFLENGQILINHAAL